jgi:diguanylate cyclase (GGDEF)-like protein
LPLSLSPSNGAPTSAWRHVSDLYGQRSADCGRIRAALLGSVIRLTPFTMASNIGCATLVLWVFRQHLGMTMWAWWGLLAGVSTLATATWWRHGRTPRTKVSRRSLRRSTWHAALLAAIWTVPTLLWFPGGDAAQQLLVATLVTGMMGAGAYVLSPLPLASLAWSCIFTASAMGALWRAGNPAMLGTALMLAFYAPMVAIGSFSASRKQASLLRANARTERQERMLAVLLQDFEQSAEDALWQTGADGCITHQSSRLASLLGVDARQLRETPLLTLLQDQGVTGLSHLREALDAGRPFRDLPLAVGSGPTQRHLVMNGKRLLDEQGRTMGWRGALTDVTERVASQQRLQQLAHTDSLTGLANRHTLRAALASALKKGRKLALLSLDLDHFKAVNDTLGHTAGDEVLKAVSARLRGCMRPGDLVARLGGDEFAVLMSHAAQPEDAAALAQRLIESLSMPIEVAQRRLRVGASVGGAWCEGGGTSVDELLVRADMALYAAKDEGRGRYALYAPAMGERSRRRLALEHGLRQAVEAGQLALHWQPKVDIESWRIVGAEALLRWQHPEMGAVTPGEFIVVAEQAGLIDEIGHWALLQACQAAAGPLAGLVVSVNVSPMQLRDEHYVSRVRNALRETRLDPMRLELEITESVFMGDAEGMLEKLHALRSLGVRIALDDFGTGYSSLAYLRRFPFDTLKIDRAFVSEVLLRKDARAIVQTIAQMATTLGMRTVSEGVESAPQLAAVAQAGCDEVQGYLVAAPQALAGFLALQKGWKEQSPEHSVLH